MCNVTAVTKVLRPLHDGERDALSRRIIGLMSEIRRKWKQGEDREERGRGKRER